MEELEDNAYEDIDFDSNNSLHHKGSPTTLLWRPSPPAVPHTNQQNSNMGVVPPAVKPLKRPVPPPKPKKDEASVKNKQVSNHSIDIPFLPPKPLSPSRYTNPINKAASLDSSSTPQQQSLNLLSRRSETYRKIGQIPGESMTLSEFVQKHSRELPLRVRVDEGFCGSDERFIISTGDVYNLHFLKNVKNVSITDAGGRSFPIPLNSALKFGILYDPNHDPRASVEGYSFLDVTELTNAKLLPKLIMSTKACPCTDPKSSVEDNELLMIKKVGRTALKRRPFIKVFNIRTKEDKTLYDDCQGHFTTSPMHLQLYLMEIVEHFGDCLPIQAVLFSNIDTIQNENFPINLETQTVTITHSSIETSIVATCYWGDDDTGLSEEDFLPLDIPIEMEIEITILKDQSEDEDLYANTRDIFIGFDPTKVKNMKTQSDQDYDYMHKNIRVGFETDGMEIQTPSRMSNAIDTAPLLPMAFKHPLPPLPKARELPKTAPLKTVSKSLSFLSKQEAINEVAPVPVSKDTSAMTTVPPAVGKGSGQQYNSMVDLNEEVIRLDKVVTDLTKNYQRLEREVQVLKRGCIVKNESADNGTTSSAPQITQTLPIQTLPIQTLRVLPIPKTTNPDSIASNVEQLINMDCSEVLILLDAMNLSQYRAVFMEESIDGELLSECNEYVFENELHISSKLHRAKLMSLIKGQRSPVGIVENNTHYVNFSSS